MTQPAGWFDDGSGTVRWWDGARWTEHVQPPQQPSQQPPQQPSQQPGPAPRRRRRRGLILGIVAGVVVLIGGGILAVVLVVRSMLAGPQEAVEDFNEAYLAVDCSGVQDVLTDDLWPQLFADCTQFEATAGGLVDSLEGGADGFSARITSTIRELSAVATVETVETFRYADGTELVERVTYSLSRDGDDWRIYSIQTEQD